MTADWDEVKRLAADFQRAQLCSTFQRLSERNCVEIVKKLIQLKLIDVIFTSDGKEYLTPQRLLKEIQDELYIHGGRINLVELAQILGIDFSHIEAKSCEFAKSEPGVRIILGQLITSDYLDHLAEEVNENLQQSGQITIAELTKQYDLPGDFLEEVIYERLGSIIEAEPDTNDARTFFTQSYISQNRAKIRGILTGVIRPVSISSLVNTFQIPEKLFCNVAEELIKDKQLAGTLTGGRTDRAIYVPDIFTKSQNEWVDEFYKQNGYLEYDAIVRLGISDPKSFIKRRYKDENFVFLTTGCVGETILNHVESAIEETINTGVWFDVMSILPSILSSKDCQQLIQFAAKSLSMQGTTIHVYADTIIVKDSTIQSCLSSFEELMNKKAKEDIAQKPHLFLSGQPGGKTGATKKEDTTSKSKKEERKRKKGGKTGAGGGTQGRETKIRATQKKYLAGKGNEESGSDDESTFSTKGFRQQDLEFLSVDDILTHLKGHTIVFQDSPEDLLFEIASEIHKPLTKKYEEVARTMYASTVATSGSSRKKQYAEFQEKLGGLFTHITLFEKSIKLFPDEVATQLYRHLLKSLCTDAINCIVSYLSVEHGISSSSDLSAEFSSENRQKLIEKLPDDIRVILKKMNTSLNAKVLEDFWSGVESLLAAGVCDVSTRKSDRKKERMIIANHRQSLLSQLSEATDPALTLHLAVLLIFQAQTRNILNASGKFVPQIISFLQKHVPLEIYQELATYQESVIKTLTAAEDDEETERAKTFLTDMTPKIKERAIVFKKASISEAES